MCCSVGRVAQPWVASNALPELVSPAEPTARTNLGPAASRSSRLGALSQASAAVVVEAVLATWPFRHHRRPGTEILLEYLERCSGGDWQERWTASGLDDGSTAAADIIAKEGQTQVRSSLMVAIRSLSCLRVIRPSRAALIVNNVSHLALALQVAEEDPLLDRYVEEVARAGRSVSAQREALFDVATVMTPRASGSRT